MPSHPYEDGNLSAQLRVSRSAEFALTCLNLLYYFCSALMFSTVAAISSSDKTWMMSGSQKSAGSARRLRS